VIDGRHFRSDVAGRATSVPGMWRRLRRRTFGGAGRPAVFPEQWPLLAVTLIAIVGGIAIVVRVLAS